MKMHIEATTITTKDRGPSLDIEEEATMQKTHIGDKTRGRSLLFAAVILALTWGCPKAR